MSKGVVHQFKATNGEWVEINQESYDTWAATDEAAGRCQRRRLVEVTESPCQASTYDAGIEAAARFIEKRMHDYQNECGSMDHETGTTEYPKGGEEYVGELMELAEGIRAQARRQEGTQ